MTIKRKPFKETKTYQKMKEGVIMEKKKLSTQPSKSRSKSQFYKNPAYWKDKAFLLLFFFLILNLLFCIIAAILAIFDSLVPEAFWFGIFLCATSSLLMTLTCVKRDFTRNKTSTKRDAITVTTFLIKK